MAIRDARPSDAEAIGRVRVRAWQAAYRDFLPREYLDALDPAANLDALRGAIASGKPAPVVKVLEAGGDVAAFSIIGKPASRFTRLRSRW
jgi:hypothetical protein